MIDNFTRNRFAWLAQVHADHELSRLGLHVAFAIAAYVNRDTGEAWPSQSRLADDCGITRNGLRKAIDALNERGHLHVEAGQGRAHSSRYRWIIAEKGNSRCPIEQKKGQQPLPYSDAKRATAVAEKGNSRSLKRATAVATNSYKELLEEHTPPVAGVVSESDTVSKREIEEGKAHASPHPSSAGLFGDTAPANLRLVVADVKHPAKTAAAADQTFERFRAAYPKRPGSNWAKARESFDRAVKRGTKPDEIIAGAEAYAAYCAREGNVGERARFIKLPVTWLNQSEWAADYAPAPLTASAARPSGGAALAPEQWRAAIERFHNTGTWPPTLGPRPGAEGCFAPPVLLSEFGVA